MCILNEKPLFAVTGITKNYSIKLNYFWCIKHYKSKHFRKHILVSEFWLVFKLWTRTLLLKISFKKFDFKMYLNFAHWGKTSCISKPRYSLIKTVWLKFDQDKILLRTAHQIPQTRNTYQLTCQNHWLGLRGWLNGPMVI